VHLVCCIEDVNRAKGQAGFAPNREVKFVDTPRWNRKARVAHFRKGVELTGQYVDLSVGIQVVFQNKIKVVSGVKRGVKTGRGAQVQVPIHQTQVHADSDVKNIGYAAASLCVHIGIEERLNTSLGIGRAQIQVVSQTGVATRPDRQIDAEGTHDGDGKCPY